MYSVLNRCGKIPNPPNNGALACDIWLGGQFCQTFCKDGYDVSPGRNFEEMLICDDSGKWFPHNSLPLPDCSSIHVSASLSIFFIHYQICKYA